MQTTFHKVSRYSSQRKKFLLFQFEIQQHPKIAKLKSNYRKHCFMFLPPLKMTFDVLNIQLVFLENHQPLFTSSSTSSLCLKFVQKYSNCNHVQKYLRKILRFNLTKGCKCSWHLTNIGCKVFLSYSSIRATPCSLSTNDDTYMKILKPWFTIK